MKNKSKIIVILLISVLIISLGYNLYQHNKMNKIKRELTHIVSENIEEFVSYVGIIGDEHAYEKQIESIDTANEVYVTLLHNTATTSDEWDYNLSSLFNKIQFALLDDPEKLQRTFIDEHASSLMLKISKDLRDKESINELNKLLSTHEK